MLPALVFSLLLVSLASLGSWILGRWLIGQRPRSALAIACAAVGISCILVAGGAAIFAVPTWMQRLTILTGFTPDDTDSTSQSSAAHSATIETSSSDPSDADLQLKSAAAMKAGDQRHAGLVQQKRSHDVPPSSSEAANTPANTNASLPDVAAHDHSEMDYAESPPTLAGPAGGSAPVLEDWPATECVSSQRSAVGAMTRVSLLGECDRTVAVVLAWCPDADVNCGPNAVAPVWKYSRSGILLTGALERPLMRRIDGDLPVIASSYSWSERADQQRRVRYLACYVTSPRLLEFIEQLRSSELDGDAGRQFADSAAEDPCYQRVVNWSRAGNRTGKSLDAMLRDGFGHGSGETLVLK